MDLCKDLMRHADSSTTPRYYTLIVPRADRTGPTNVAVDIGRAALAAGWQVALLYLSGTPSRSDFDGFHSVRQWRFSDILTLRGVIHSHGLRPDLVGWLFSWNQRCTVITTLHGHFPHHLTFDYPKWKAAFAWAVWAYALRRFHYRVCISKTMCRYYRRSLPDLSFNLAYNFRASEEATSLKAPSSFETWLTCQRAANRTVLAYVGSLSTRKNVQPMLEAVLRDPDLCLVVCGDGPLKTWFTERMTSGTLEDRLLFLGQQLHPLFIVARSDMLVLPSHAEGLPLVVLEAASVCRPTLMSNIAVHRELATLGLGMVFDRHKFTDFSEKAQALALRTPDATLGKLWEERFSSSMGFDRYNKIVNNILDLNSTIN